jgi:enamine deaminase RidA (YjgF/YER057c/UK114 family)
MNTVLNPHTIAPPYKNRYSHAFVVPGGSRLLITAGTVGVRSDGSVPNEFAEQAQLVMDNLTEILKAADMTWKDVVKFTGYLKPQCDLPTFAEIRHKYFGPEKPAMTLVWVSGLVDSRWMIEVEIIAAK